MGQRRRYAPTTCSKDKIFNGEGVWLKTFDNDLCGYRRGSGEVRKDVISNLALHISTTILGNSKMRHLRIILAKQNEVFGAVALYFCNY